MIPCRYCDPPGAPPAIAHRGMKQTGRTVQQGGGKAKRRYRCQDCGATCEMFMDLGSETPRALDVWKLPGAK